MKLEYTGAITQWLVEFKKAYDHLGGKFCIIFSWSPPAAFLSVLEGMNTVRKYLIKFDVDDNMMDTHSGSENKVYRVQQKVKKQPLTIMDTWNK